MFACVCVCACVRACVRVCVCVCVSVFGGPLVKFWDGDMHSPANRSAAKLDLSGNQLTGTVPSGVTALVPLTAAGWSSNCLVNTTGRYANCDHPARAALVDLHQSTQGDLWTVATNWLSGSLSPCYWFGVSCVSDVVVALSLSSNGVGGSLPGSIGTLSNLTCVSRWCGHSCTRMSTQMWSRCRATAAMKHAGSWMSA